MNNLPETKKNNELSWRSQEKCFERFFDSIQGAVHHPGAERKLITFDMDDVLANNYRERCEKTNVLVSDHCYFCRWPSTIDLLHTIAKKMVICNKNIVLTNWSSTIRYDTIAQYGLLRSCIIIRVSASFSVIIGWKLKVCSTLTGPSDCILLAVMFVLV